MSSVESYDILDWLAMSSQSQTGLNVQLPGSENLLPVHNGYLVDATANLLQDTKHHSRVDDFLDIAEEDDWNCFGSIGFSASGDICDGDLMMDAFDLLPASPEITSFDLDALSREQSLSRAALDRKSLAENFLKPENLTEGVVLGSDLELNVKSSGHQTKSIPEDIFESGSLCDFETTWLLSQVPILPLEEVESVLSASPPLDVISDEVSLSPTAIETYANGIQFATTPLQFADAQLENMQLSASPFSIFLTNNIAGDGAACSSIESSQNLTSIGGCSPVHSLGLYSGFSDFDVGLSARVTSSDSLSSLDLDHVNSPSDVEESRYTTSPLPIRSSPVSGSPRVEPYPTSGIKPERRERKREQNKTAALKYRQKKREEQGVFVSECEQLEKRNSELKSRVEELTREISYLKGLISEIYSSQAE